METILTSANLVSFKGPIAAISCVCALVAGDIATAARLNAIMNLTNERRPGSLPSAIVSS